MLLLLAGLQLESVTFARMVACSCSFGPATVHRGYGSENVHLMVAGKQKKGKEANFPPDPAPASLASSHWAASPTTAQCCPGWGCPVLPWLGLGQASKTWAFGEYLFKPLLGLSVLLHQQVCCKAAVSSLSNWLLTPSEHLRSPNPPFLTL